MLLLVIFALSTVILFALFWGGSLVAQGYLYQQPASRLPLRAAIAALWVGGFTATWVAIDKKNPGKYDTFFSFYGETTREFDEFEAVRWTFDPAAKALKSDAQGGPISRSQNQQEVLAQRHQHDDGGPVGARRERLDTVRRAIHEGQPHGDSELHEGRALRRGKRGSVHSHEPDRGDVHSERRRDRHGALLELPAICRLDDRILAGVAVLVGPRLRVHGGIRLRDALACAAALVRHGSQNRRVTRKKHRQECLCHQVTIMI